MTPEQIKKDIEKTLKELKDYGKTITFDASGKSLKELQDNLKVFQAGLKETKRAAEEIGDSFETTLESLINAQESVKDLSSVLKSALTPELKVAQKSVLKTLNIQKELNQGYGSEAEILRNIRKIKYSISNLDALNKTAGDDAVTATIQNLNYTQDVANKQLEIVQSSEAITKNISSFSNLLSEIPVIGKAISGPFKDIADEINKASKAEQSLTLSLKGYGDQLERLKELDRTKYSDEELKIIDNKIKELKKNITETKIELDTLPKPLSNISEKIKKISLQGLAIGILTKAIYYIKISYYRSR
jgi:chromosome segregation ATPase